MNLLTPPHASLSLYIFLLKTCSGVLLLKVCPKLFLSFPEYKQKYFKLLVLVAKFLLIIPKLCLINRSISFEEYKKSIQVNGGGKYGLLSSIFPEDDDSIGCECLKCVFVTTYYYNMHVIVRIAIYLFFVDFKSGSLQNL